jgi:hypothetical protein
MIGKLRRLSKRDYRYFRRRYYKDEAVLSSPGSSEFEHDDNKIRDYTSIGRINTMMIKNYKSQHKRI